VSITAACSRRTPGKALFAPRNTSRNTPRVQVGDIARTYGAALRDSCALSGEQRAVLRAIERCRTAKLGGHMHVCNSCGYAVPVYNSCRNRHCPTCQSLEQHRWLERRRERILPTRYFHVVFTLPAELRCIVMAQRERLFAMLLQAASETLLTLAGDEKRLGATPAITMVLHTWTRELAFHPHVHAIVSAGGLRTGKVPQWVQGSDRYLFPVKVMAKLFRGLFRAALLHAIETGAVTVPAEVDAAWRDVLFDKRWVVYAKAPFGGADQVFSYLGRYTHRVGISSSRIMRSDPDGVTFATKHGRSCTLLQVEFLRRLLLHVLPKGFHKIRHYGLCSASHVRLGTLQRAQALLIAKHAHSAQRAATAHVKAPQTWVECLLALTGLDVMRCPRCDNGHLTRRPLPEPSSPALRDTS
jgi:Putative transposase/Transposase zinc-binding domain